MKRAMLLLLFLASPVAAQSLPGTAALTGKDDFARVMVEGIERYLAKAAVTTAKERGRHWKPDLSSEQAFDQSVLPNRKRLRKMLGVVDARLPVAMELVATTTQSSTVATTPTYQVKAVRWPVLAGMHGEGLLLEPVGTPKALVVALPDADWTPEQLVGLSPGVPKESQYARRLAEEGYRVVVPMLLNRKDDFSGSPRLGRFTNQPHREFVYRMAFEMGRHVIGYEIQKVLSVVDWFAADPKHPPISVVGYGEGGLVALYSAALDPRIRHTHVSSCVGDVGELHREPIYRNVFGLAKEFGSAELLMLAGAPGGGRTVHVEHAQAPDVAGPPKPRAGRTGAAPGSLHVQTAEMAHAEYERFQAMAKFTSTWHAAPKEPPFLHLRKEMHTALTREPEPKLIEPRTTEPKELRLDYDPNVRQKRQFDESVAFTQNLLGPAPKRRDQHTWSKFDLSSLPKFEKSQETVRNDFWENTIGKLPESTAPLNPRTRLVYDEPKWKGYEVVLDLNEDVICYGLLLVPNDIKPGEKRPCVVCQHGLEGRPVDVCNPKVKTNYYHSFGAQLADRGYVVFAPQNPYIFQNQFRQLVRQGNPLGLSLYSFIVGQHSRILDWLGVLPFVDSARIAYYGLSYGGKVAMRIPSILTRYCLSICSGDFNEWIWKNITLDWQGSYMFTNEYDMYEFNLGNTFNYAEMAALIAPRPFMVERGHSDGVGIDEQVAFEYARVRRFYAQLGIADRTEIEFFVGGHVIQGRGTFAFLQKHLNYPAK
jgi:dienelactone hydrolase